MTRRSILISLFFVVPVVVLIAMVVWHQHKYPLSRFGIPSVPLDRNAVDSALLKGEGISRDITAQEFTDATNILVQEHRMWSRLNEMSAGINIEFDGSNATHLSLEGTVLLRRLELSPVEKRAGIIAKYGMVISNKHDGWTVKTDDTFYKLVKDGANTVISCQDPQMLETIKTIGPESILHMLTFPQYFLASFYRDDLYPQIKKGVITPSVTLKVWSPWVVTNEAPHSYTFWAAQQSQRLLDMLAKAGQRSYTSDYRNTFPDLTFVNGHLSRVRRMGLKLPGNILKEQMAICFENPVESNGFWYPTVFRMTPAPTPWPYPGMDWGFFVPEGSLAPAGQLRITLSDVSLSVK
jgi:hypothetical protein